MNARRLDLASLALALGTIASPAAAIDLPTTGAVGVPANRIVGTWANQALVGPCGGTPLEVQRQTLKFGAGGMFLDNARFPPAGVSNLHGVSGLHHRSIGVGDWTYSPATGQYTLDQRFDWYVNNAYHGYQVVRRTILLSADGSTASGPVRTVRYTAAGATVFEACGNAVSTRL